MSIPALFGLEIDPSTLPHTVSVERQTATGRDQSGAPAEVWAVVYPALQCLVTNAGTQEMQEYQARGITASHRIYFGQQPDGTLPLLGVRDRVIFGTWANGARRVLEAQWAQDEMEAGVVLTVDAQERMPGI